jgi:dipeptidyl aminopeptidase/acylaminoacyl peptidase
MFHNLLTDLGYTVLDIDYRGSGMAMVGIRNWNSWGFMEVKIYLDQIDGKGKIT